MDAEQTRGTSGVQGVAIGLLMLGGVLAVLGSALNWFRFSANLSGVGGATTTNSVKGLDGSDGVITLILGLVLVVVGVLLATVRARGSRLGLALGGLLAALVAGGIGIYDAATAKSRAISSAVGKVPLGQRVQIRALLDRLFASGVLKISLQIGIILLVIGAGIAVIGALVALVSPQPQPAVQVPQAAIPPPPEDAGAAPQAPVPPPPDQAVATPQAVPPPPPEPQPSRPVQVEPAPPPAPQPGSLPQTEQPAAPVERPEQSPSEDPGDS